MKFQIRFLLTLVILLSGFGQFSAHANNNIGNTQGEKNHQEFQVLNSDSVYNALTPIINYSLCHVEKLNDKFYTTDTENEENELSSKKWLVAKGHFSTAFYTHSLKFLNHDIKKCLPSGKFILPLYSCKRYIMFRVFRI